MRYKDLATQFWADGYIAIDNFFGASELAELDTLTRAHFGSNPSFLHTDEFLREAQTDVIPWFPQNEDTPSAFDRIDEHEGLQSLTDEILGEGWRSDYCMVMFSSAGSAGQAWHQDCPPEDPRSHNLNRLVYTSDITAQSGGQLVVVPGSFKTGLLPAGDPNGKISGECVLTPRCGTLVLLHGHTWHRVLPVRRGNRFSTNYRARPTGTPDDLTDVCVYRNMRYRFSTASIIEQRSVT